MTKDMIEMAKKAGIPTGSRFVGGEVVECLTLEVQAFAKLVAAKECEACAEDKKDAERYRHMRNSAQFQSRNGPGLYWYLPRGLRGNEGKQLDEAIDAAIRARGEA